MIGKGLQPTIKGWEARAANVVGLSMHDVACEYTYIIGESHVRDGKSSKYRCQ